MLHNFKENKRHPKLTQKATLSHSAELDFSIFSPAGNPPPAFWEGSSRHSIFRVLVIKDLPAEPRPEPANAIFWLLGWLARATSLDSALLFCSMTLSMCTQWGNKVIFSHFISLPGQLATAKRRSDEVTGVKLTKSSQQRAGSGKEEKVLLCVCTQQFRALHILPLTWEWFQYKGRQDKMVLRRKLSRTIKGLR